jgi:hypothetical protein
MRQRDKTAFVKILKAIAVLLIGAVLLAINKNAGFGGIQLGAIPVMVICCLFWFGYKKWASMGGTKEKSEDKPEDKPDEAEWNEGFGHLKAFYQREGHCQVHNSFKTDGGFRLGIWVNTQRTKQDTMLPERKDRLDGLGFEWYPQ